MAQKDRTNTSKVVTQILQYNSCMFEYKILGKDTKSKARTGEFNTPHGKLLTPALATVATEGQIRSVSPEIAQKLPVNYSIVNTFHIWTKGIIDKIS